MPVYEYRCPNCARLFEKLVGFSQADRDAECPSCGERAGKVLSTFAAIGSSSSNSNAVPSMAPSGGGGCCGGGCCGGG